MKHFKTAALCGLAALMLTTAVRAEDLSVEVYTNWVSGGESKALNAIATAFEAAGGTWIDDAVPGDSIAPAVSRIVAGDPMGAAKMQATDLDELYAAGLVADIDQVATDNHWKDRLADFVWASITRDGIPRWRVYIHVIPAMIRPMILTAAVLLSLTAIKIYDLVVVMTGGGPGISTTVPALYVMDMLNQRANLGQATAAATMMLLAVCLAVGLPLALMKARK